MIKLEEFLKIITEPDKLRIQKDGKDIYVGYMGNLTHAGEDMKEYMQQPVKRFRAVPEMRHKDWEKRKLMPPLRPEDCPTISFSDLNMTLYYTIIL